MPDEWRKSMLVPLYKSKGDINECGNYWGIKLMSHEIVGEDYRSKDVGEDYRSKDEEGGNLGSCQEGVPLTHSFV